MKYFGTVKNFDDTQGRGSLMPDTGGAELRFERSAFAWESRVSPKLGDRLSYDLAHTNGNPSAINLAKI
jgi:cold shock CspA family protein